MDELSHGFEIDSETANGMITKPRLQQMLSLWPAASVAGMGVIEQQLLTAQC